MLRAVLFDLDGTLLDIDLDLFFEGYFGLLGPAIADLLPEVDADSALKAVMASTETMCGTHPDRTNREVFNARFAELTGADLADPVIAEGLDRFYAEQFPRLAEGHGPMPCARETVETALGLGLRVAIATNPLFPAAAIRERMRWAGVADLDLHAVTTYEVMHACKPLPGYFTQTAQMLDVAPQDCLMVGDDRALDMAAADVGMRTFYCGSAPTPASDWSGSLEQLRDALPRLAEG